MRFLKYKIKLSPKGSFQQTFQKTCGNQDERKSPGTINKKTGTLRTRNYKLVYGTFKVL